MLSCGKGLNILPSGELCSALVHDVVLACRLTGIYDERLRYRAEGADEPGV